MGCFHISLRQIMSIYFLIFTNLVANQTALVLVLIIKLSKTIVKNMSLILLICFGKSKELLGLVGVISYRISPLNIPLKTIYKNGIAIKNIINPRIPPKEPNITINPFLVYFTKG
jgi:hypothetical protein